MLGWKLNHVSKMAPVGFIHPVICEVLRSHLFVKTNWHHKAVATSFIYTVAFCMMCVMLPLRPNHNLSHHRQLNPHPTRLYWARYCFYCMIFSSSNCYTVNLSWLFELIFWSSNVSSRWIVKMITRYAILLLYFRALCSRVLFWLSMKIKLAWS